MPTPTSLAVAAAAGERASGRQAWRLLWHSGRALALLVVGWTVASAVLPALVVVALGNIVAHVPAAIRSGMASGAGAALVGSLVLAGLAYAASLIMDPIGNALGTAAQARVTGALQARLLGAVSAPVGVGHLEDADVLDRLARAEGSLTGFLPGDAPVTWVGVLASRLSGLIGCAIIAAFRWWLGLGLLVIWLVVRAVMLRAVVRQATDQRGRTTELRRAWYFIGLGTKVRDAKEVRVFGLPGFVADRFHLFNRQAMRTAGAALRDLHLRAGACWVAVLGAYTVALLTIAFAARDGSISLRALATLLPMLPVSASAGSVSFQDITLAWALSGLPDVDRLEADLRAGVRPGSAALDATVNGAPKPAATIQPLDGRPRHAVRFEGVSFRYPAGVDVLSELDLELVAGTSTAIVGVNGAGKSTLVSLLSRLRDPTAGAITADGVDIRGFDAAAWQRNVAIMPQEPVRYPISAYDNIAFGALDYRADRAGIEEAARLSGFAEVLERLPNGWDTVLSRELPGGTDLSGGQWQRLALARALFATRHGARLLVLDEPTAALDVRSEAAFYRRFLQLSRGLTTVVISHRFATVRRAQAICVLDGGRITERGSHEELLALDGSYAAAYRVQAARFSDGPQRGGDPPGRG